jgi:hypothetical protein
MGKFIAALLACLIVPVTTAISANATTTVTGQACVMKDYAVYQGRSIVFSFAGPCQYLGVYETVPGATIDSSGITGGFGTLIITITDASQWVNVMVSLVSEQWVKGCDRVESGYELIRYCEPDEAGSGTAHTPAPWLQSYGRNNGATCMAGWHASWAEWAVLKSGGWVCNRTIFWNGSTWVQNPNAVWGALDASQTGPWDGS